MTDLELLKLAKEAGLILTAERETPGWSAPLPGATYPDRLERFAALVRAEVLEEAAEWFLYEDNKHLFHSEMLWPHQVAERLRQLKDKP